MTLKKQNKQHKYKSMKNKNKDIMYILFADIKGYSANKKNLDLLAEIEDLLYGFGESYFNDTKNNCFKVLGDGMLATNYDIKTMAESALKIIETFKTKEKNGDFEHFTEKPQIRIALHLGKKEKITERRLKDNALKDVAGEPIIETARIEPIVMPNEVFCSQYFANALEFFNAENIEATKLGNFELGKTHDSFKIDLCVLHAKDENKDVENFKEHIESKLVDKNKTYNEEATDLCKMSFLECGLPTFTQQANVKVEGNENDTFVNIQGSTINTNRNKK
ncbi:MAG: hypothetical protein EAZ85_07470 [Bacteroidetes bacterium]|nr:MAG: hypothetical protein EAZ85_07470 [Bacteroidota bacterium]